MGTRGCLGIRMNGEIHYLYSSDIDSEFGLKVIRLVQTLGSDSNMSMLLIDALQKVEWVDGFSNPTIEQMNGFSGVYRSNGQHNIDFETKKVIYNDQWDVYNYEWFSVFILEPVDCMYFMCDHHLSHIPELKKVELDKYNIWLKEIYIIDFDASMLVMYKDCLLVSVSDFGSITKGAAESEKLLYAIEDI